MMLRKKTKESPAKSCLLTLLTLVGLMLACFLFCTVMFYLNQWSVNQQTTTTTGSSLFAWLFG
jgi:hypothetical protein